MREKQTANNLLSPQEIERYARHIVLHDIGGSGQQLLKEAKVLVIGAGGLGSPVIQYLAAAGVGTVGVVDDDRVSVSNLQRQIIHDSDKIGTLKTQSAAQAIERLNPHVKCQQWPIRLTPENAYALLSQYDVVADGSDNFDTRFLVADICELLSIPLVHAAVSQFDGSITTLKPYERDANANQHPALRDIFPVKPENGSIASCEEAGVIGTLTGMLGTMQAQEVIKLITNAGECLIGRLLMVDAKSMRFEIVRYKRAR